MCWVWSVFYEGFSSTMHRKSFVGFVLVFGTVAALGSFSKGPGFLEFIIYRKGQASHKMPGYNLNPHDQGSISSIQLDENRKRSGYRHAKEQHCSCKAMYRPFELGRKYFPRYVSMAHCDPNVCANRTHTCQQKIYTIKVLRERNREELVPLDSFLPESLRADWLFEDVPVAVTCECVA